MTSPTFEPITQIRSLLHVKVTADNYQFVFSSVWLVSPAESRSRSGCSGQVFVTDFPAGVSSQHRKPSQKCAQNTPGEGKTTESVRPGPDSGQNGQILRKVWVSVCDISVAGPSYQFCFPEPCWTFHHTWFAVASNSAQDRATALTATRRGKGGEAQLRPMRMQMSSYVGV